ncbi:MAG: citrate lyase acyl carrier protein [Oscillospiraceae bacterium]|nr:citrate lyase acyl carrier protein [Oscillospiraceae bacterium]
MIIEKPAAAGTLESCDAQVIVEPGNGGVELELDSKVIHQFGRQIRAVILDTLCRLDVTDAKVTVKDMGALDCTIRARVEAAVYRSAGQTDQIPWEKLADEK